ncbi:Os01g0681650, partial [Oryza sativa Japonica Group]
MDFVSAPSSSSISLSLSLSLSSSYKSFLRHSPNLKLLGIFPTAWLGHGLPLPKRGAHRLLNRINATLGILAVLLEVFVHLGRLHTTATRFLSLLLDEILRELLELAICGLGLPL